MNFLGAIQKSIQSYIDGASFQSLEEVTEGGLKYDKSFFDDLEKEMMLSEGDMTQAEKEVLASKSKAEKSVLDEIEMDEGLVGGFLSAPMEEPMDDSTDYAILDDDLRL